MGRHDIIQVFASGDTADFARHPSSTLIGIPAGLIHTDQQSLASWTDDELRFALSHIQHMDLQSSRSPSSGWQRRIVGAALGWVAVDHAPGAAIWFTATAHIRGG